MDFANIRTAQVLKIAGIALMVIIVLAIGAKLLVPTFTSIVPQLGNTMGSSKMMYDSEESYAVGEAGMAYGGADMMGVSLSTRNIVGSPTPTPMPPRDGNYVSGDDAEEFEVTEYSARIETRHLQDDCTRIAGLKTRTDIIFENTNEYDRGCSYSFKVASESVDEIVALLNSMDPKDLSENTYTIKRLIDDFTSETEILERQLAAIDETLESAISSYDDITALATRTQDAETLAKIIESKLSVIERLTQSRINTAAQLERLSRAKAEQLDRLNYTYFHVNITENKFVDGEQIRDSWKSAVKTFVRDVNSILQDLTVNLISLILLIIQYVLYAFIVVVVVKYGWVVVKRIWER